MKSFRSIPLTLLALTLISACGFKFKAGKDVSSDDNKTSVSSSSKTEKYSYEFSEGGCRTGRHEFSSFNAYCEGLKDDARNKGCAFTLRLAAFQQKSCPGPFVAATPKPEPKPTPKPEPKPEEVSARNAFAPTFVRGAKRFTFKDMLVTIEIKDTTTQQTKKNMTMKCNSTTPLEVNGDYPDVMFKFGKVNCSETNIPYVWTRAIMALQQVRYRAHHIPATPDHVSQFRMQLTDLQQSSTLEDFRIEDAEGLNSVVQLDSVSFNVVGKTRGSDPRRFNGYHNYLSVYLVEGRDRRVTMDGIFMLDGMSNESVTFTFRQTLNSL